MAGHDIILIGGSAGGIATLRELLPHLPADLPATIFVTVHRAPTQTPADLLPPILQRPCALEVVAASDGGEFGRGQVVVVPPRSSVWFEDGRVRLTDGDGPTGSNVDAMFRAAAVSYGPRVVGVVLSGALHDGTAGMWDVRRHGGVTIVHDPELAEYPSMPRTALEEVPLHYCLPIAEVASKLVQLANEPSPVRWSPRVLIVEDDGVVATNLHDGLIAVGYHIVGSVESGEEALAMFRAAAPDVVLMDVHLAGRMTGTEAARRIAHDFGVPVVYLTAYSDEKTLAEAKGSAHGFVVKPYRVAQVHAALQVALERRERDPELAPAPA
jgi:chemotaxis response regulator CheB